MKREELLELIGTGEGYTLEFKESLPSDLGKLPNFLLDCSLASI